MYSKLLEYAGLKIMTQLTNNIYETGDWPKDFTEATMTDLKKSQKLQYAVTTAHAAETAATILRRRTEMNSLGCTYGLVWILKRKRNLGCNWGAQNNIRTNFGHRQRNVRLLHRLAEDI